MIDLEKAKKQLHEDLVWRPLNKTWAKLELFLGLFVVGLALLGPEALFLGVDDQILGDLPDQLLGAERNEWVPAPSDCYCSYSEGTSPWLATEVIFTNPKTIERLTSWS